MKSHHPIPPGGSGLLWMESKPRGGGSLGPDLVVNVGYLVSLSACPCLRLPSCEIKLHTPPSQMVCVRRKASWRGTGRDSCGRSSWRWQHNAGSTFLDGLWVMQREQADSGTVAWRKSVCERESERVAAEPGGADRACAALAGNTGTGCGTALEGV